ncbi:MAG: twin-arginine translocase subunit TatC [Planctomycetes bacterium]|nr:twin-arginine translocase subunit TatC [Planctomycetota bacterium]
MDESTDKPDRMALGDHLDDLRRRLIYALIGLAVGMTGGLVEAGDIIRFLQKPYMEIARQSGMSNTLVAMSLTDGISTYCEVGFYAGLMVSSPWVFWQLWMFVSVGLLPRERRYVLLAAPASAGLFVAGAAFFFFVVSGPMLGFLVMFNNFMGLAMFLTLDHYISFIAGMVITFGLAFQMPLAVMLLAKMGIVGTAGLARYRKHVILALVIAAAVIVPTPSPIDQLMLAIPLCALYELGILLAKIVTRPKKPEAA